MTPTMAARADQQTIAAVVAGCAPAEAAVAAARRPIGIEALVRWAVAQSPTPRLRVPSPRELTLNPYDVHVRGADNRYFGAGIAIAGGRSAIDHDADLVLRAIDALDPWSRSIVLVNARAGRRPDWMEGVDPRLVSTGKRKRRKQRWNPCSPQAVRATRDAYTRWHGALTLLARRLDGRLELWNINGLDAPLAPWAVPRTKSG